MTDRVRNFLDVIVSGKGWFKGRSGGIYEASIRDENWEYYRFSWYCGDGWDVDDAYRGSSVPRGQPAFSPAERNELLKRLTEYARNGC